MSEHMRGAKQQGGFGERLRAAMKRRGFVSESSRSGVDVGALAKATGTSYEMARRYAEGTAVPRQDKLDAIARWLGLPPATLMWGSASADAVDAEVLQRCLSAISEAQARTGVHLSTEKAARLVALLYGEAMAGRFPADRAVDLLVIA